MTGLTIGLEASLNVEEQSCRSKGKQRAHTAFYSKRAPGEGAHATHWEQFNAELLAFIKS